MKLKILEQIYVLIALDLITGQRNVNHAWDVKNVIGTTILASAIIVLTASSAGNSIVTYPVVIVKVNGVKCHALLGTGAGNSYASSGLRGGSTQKLPKK